MAKKKGLSVQVYNLAGEEVSTLELDPTIWSADVNEQVMFDAVQVEQSNRRQATAKTKVRHEVSGGGKKPFRQKGTGRARAGSTRSPIWVGGGTVFGPDGNQNFKLSQNKKEHTLAVKSALTLKAQEGLKVVNELTLDNAKTSNFVKVLDNLKVFGKALVVVNEYEENLCLASRNVGYVKLVDSTNVSVYDLLNTDYLVITEKAVKAVEEALR